MSDPIFLVGLVGSLILITGAAWPVGSALHPAKSAKNRLFALGNACMFTYALLNYLNGGDTIFFVILQCLIAVSTVLMLLDTPDVIDVAVLGVAGIGLIAWALSLFEGYSTILFVAGLVLLAIGFAMDLTSQRRNILLFIGSALIAYFSYLGASWIFFWLNTFFAVFSLQQAHTLRQKVH